MCPAFRPLPGGAVWSVREQLNPRAESGQEEGSRTPKERITVSWSIGGALRITTPTLATALPAANGVERTTACPNLLAKVIHIVAFIACPSI